MIKDDSFFSSDEEDNVNIDMPNLGGLLLDEGTNIKTETDAFEDAGKREKIHIHYQKRNNRKTWTKIEGIEKDMAKKISKKWKKLWGCNASLQKDEETEQTVLVLNGDHRGKVSRFLLENKIAEEDEMEIHGPNIVD